MDAPRHTEATQPTTERKLVVNIPEELLKSLRSSCAEKSNVALLGRIQGKHPGLKALTAWARATLHPSLAFLSLKANNLFEITFSTPEGRIHALTQADLVCESASISFSSWRPHFDSRTQRATEQLDFPIWMQIVDLCQILRDEALLRTVGEHIGQVIAIDNSEAYRAKLFGPRVRLLVNNLDDLPQSVVLPRLDGEGIVEYNLEYSGLPHQCGRCRSREHQVRNCPKKDQKFHRREYQPRATFLPRNVTRPTADTTEAAHPPSSTPIEPAPTRKEEAEPVPAHEEESITRLAAEDILPPTDVQAEIPASTNTHQTSSPQDIREQPSDAPPELQPTEENFPQLSSPGLRQEHTTPQSPIEQPPNTPQTFIWRMKPQPDSDTPNKGKDKLKQTSSESTPITRQGYRSGRLAEDFWEVLGIPDTPQTHKKKLRVLPLLTKNHSQKEYLVDTSKQTPTPITTVHIAEVLAGIPWTSHRARQHIVNEVAQGLHKVLIFNNQHNTPFQKWSQGKWQASWSNTAEGEHQCTLYAIIATPENKVRIRKGKYFQWRPIPESITEFLTCESSDAIQPVGERSSLWQEMTGSKETLSQATTSQTQTAVVKKSFSALLNAEVLSS